jgi:aspartyl-tRNA(Asn)/glutamyl-tRNA(Gln) amidotransferase subunit B
MVQETRLWDAQKAVTVVMRTKEGAKDYRYFPDPDLAVFIIEQSMIAQIKAQLPELPQLKMCRFIKEYGLTQYDAKILVSSKNDAEFAESCIQDYPGKDKKEMVNWLIGPLLSEANERKVKLHELNLNKNELISLIGFLQRQEISYLSAKSVLSQLIDTQKSARDLIESGNLGQISNTDALKQVIETVIRENAKSVSDFKAGKTNALMYLVGQVMKKSSGKANPKVVGELIRGRLD